MVVDDWARTSAPREFALPDQRDELLARYASEQKSAQLALLLDYADELDADLVYRESPYVDFDYRSEYSNLYARSFNPPPDKCERLLFFAAGRFLGSAVMRPSPKPVGRTAIVPPDSVKPFVCCLAPHAVRPYGQRLSVDAWPFLSQDGVYGRCAHAAIWAICRYHHLQHNGRRCSIASIVEASGTRIGADTTFRSSGLYLHEVADAFAGLGLPVFAYAPEDLSSGESLEAVVCRYLNSGFPVALSTPRHLTVLVGYGHKEGEVFFIRSDDNYEPYERVDRWRDGADRLGKWDMLLVPLPARIHVPGEVAEIRARIVFAEQVGAVQETERILDELRAGELRIRTYAIEAAEYKAALPERGLGAEVTRHHQLTPASVWIWVTEFQRRSEQGTRRVVGEVAIDATSHPARPSPVFANLPGRVVAWLPEDPVPLAKPVEPVELHDSALADRIDA